jgi:pimeloyl-ACP methyl ester carboxylesterase
MNIEDWKQKGQPIDVYGHPVFYIQHHIDKPTICFLHGYPSASYDYLHVLPLLEEDFSYVIHDQLGYGFSSKPDNYSYSLIEQAEVAIELWRKLGLKEIHLVSHDYGTSVANEIVVRRLRGFEPVKIKSVTFCNGSMHIELAKLKLVQKLMKHTFWGKYMAALSNKRSFTQTMRSIWYDKSKFNKEEIENLYDLLRLNSTNAIFHKVSLYNNERVKYWHRWIGNLPNLDIPAHVLWAQQDPIAVKTIAEQLAKEIPNAVYTKIDNCGHYPMLEQPIEWANHVMRFVKGLDG